MRRHHLGQVQWQGHYLDQQHVAHRGYVQLAVLNEHRAQLLV
eukprot:CAMPEP_0181381200 /NCGR_PEP_ID=MMETSP1106-20121128/19988_1 /TAXON_ID=81844 /ORGANISM="Mantoniella antarctica, Strain SL-175" /LENGTH=41 /DNA_ID= /DNA_START= /DNA_END= /DNA_ORIENTATION=